MTNFEKLLTRFPKKDSLNNKLSVDNKNNIKLYQPAKEKNRNMDIGQFKDYNNRIVYLKKEKNNDVFRAIKGGAWSINYGILEELSNNDIVIYYTKDPMGSFIYISNVKNLKYKGQFLHFKKSGFEKKIYVALKHWDKYDYIDFTKNRNEIMDKYLKEDNRQKVKQVDKQLTFWG